MHTSEIAQDLGVGMRIVKVHVHHVNSKLGISDRTHAVVRAIDLGLLASESG